MRTPLTIRFTAVLILATFSSTPMTWAASLDTLRTVQHQEHQPSQVVAALTAGLEEQPRPLSPAAIEAVTGLMQTRFPYYDVSKVVGDSLHDKRPSVEYWAGQVFGSSLMTGGEPSARRLLAVARVAAEAASGHWAAPVFSLEGLQRESQETAVATMRTIEAYLKTPTPESRQTALDALGGAKAGTMLDRIVALASAGLEEVGELAVRQVADNMEAWLKRRQFVVSHGALPSGGHLLAISQVPDDLREYWTGPLDLSVGLRADGHIQVRLRAGKSGRDSENSAIADRVGAIVSNVFMRLRSGGAMGVESGGSWGPREASWDVSIDEPGTVQARQAVIDLVDPAVPVVKAMPGARKERQEPLVVFIDDNAIQATDGELAAIEAVFKTLHEQGAHPAISIIRLTTGTDPAVVEQTAKTGRAIRLTTQEWFYRSILVPTVHLTGLKDPMRADIFPAVMTGILGQWPNEHTLLDGYDSMSFDITPYLNITGLTLDDIWHILTERFA